MKLFWSAKEIGNWFRKLLAVVIRFSFFVAISWVLMPRTKNHVLLIGIYAIGIGAICNSVSWNYTERIIPWLTRGAQERRWAGQLVDRGYRPIEVVHAVAILRISDRVFRSVGLVGHENDGTESIPRLAWPSLGDWRGPTYILNLPLGVTPKNFEDQRVNLGSRFGCPIKIDDLLNSDIIRVQFYLREAPEPTEQGFNLIDTDGARPFFGKVVTSFQLFGLKCCLPFYVARRVRQYEN